MDSPTTPRRSTQNTMVVPRSDASSRMSGSTTPSTSRRSVVPPPAGLTMRAQSRTSVMNTAYIARPDGSSLVTSPKKKKNLPEDLDKADTQKIENDIRKETRVLTKTAEDSITEKEDELERIMSAEAQLGFEQMGRYQLNKVHATRVAIDPARIGKLEDLDYLVNDADLDHESEHCQDLHQDSELLEMNELEVWSGSTADFNDGHEVPAWIHEIPGLRLGFGFPTEAPSPRKDGKPPPCQDSIFAARCGEYTLVGVVHGHGKPRTSDALAKKIAELLPEVFFQSPPLVRGGDAAGGFTNTFHRVHCLASETLDLKLAGASCTAMLIDSAYVWVAHVGDCRAVLAVPDPQPNAEGFHFVPNALTQDHKLSVKAEFDRVRNAGAETRKLVNDNVYRLFVQDAEVPGLVLSRAIGDRIGHAIGVNHTPSISMFERKSLPKGESFIVLGTGALWTVMSERTVVNWISRHFSDAGEAAESLSIEAHDRWEDSECKAKASLKATLTDSFASVVVFLSSDPESSAPEALEHRPFLTGARSAKENHRDFHEVFRKDRADELRKVVGRLEPTDNLP